jgi:glucosamine-6-phosphate deaminase
MADGTGMRVRVFRTAGALANALAADIARSLTARPDLVLGLPTGRTPIPLYRELVGLHRAGRADFRRATTFNLDEFLGLDGRDPHSYRAFMQRHLFDHVNVAPRRIQFLNGIARDVERECRRYERAIERAGGIDLQVLGLGTNGHVGFNEPARALVARTHVTRLKPATRRANASIFDNRASAVPREALSMGMATILHAKRIVLLATGATKARSVQRMVDGPVTPRLPGSFLQLHRCAEIWLDRAAATRLGRPGSAPPA